MDIFNITNYACLPNSLKMVILPFVPFLVLRILSILTGTQVNVAEVVDKVFGNHPYREVCCASFR